MFAHSGLGSLIGAKPSNKTSQKCGFFSLIRFLNSLIRAFAHSARTKRTKTGSGGYGRTGVVRVFFWDPVFPLILINCVISKSKLSKLAENVSVSQVGAPKNSLHLPLTALQPASWPPGLYKQDNSHKLIWVVIVPSIVSLFCFSLKYLSEVALNVSAWEYF